MKNGNGIVLCCDINDENTLNNTLEWKNSIEQNIDVVNEPMIMIKNKCDLLGSELIMIMALMNWKNSDKKMGLKIPLEQALWMDMITI